MFTDKKRAEVQDELCRRDKAVFAHILTPELFFQAARMCNLAILSSPLNLITLTWLAISARRNPARCFADLLTFSLKPLQDDKSFPGSRLDELLHAAKPHGKKKSRHDPRQDADKLVSPAAFCKARERFPDEFWVALFLLLIEQFERFYADVVRWRRFRLMALDGTELTLPDYPALREHFGTANNGAGTHGAQARMVLLQFPLARLPHAFVLSPNKVGENTLARKLLQGLRRDDLILLDAGFLCYGMLWQIHNQNAFFCLRLRKDINLRHIKELRAATGANDVHVEWTPKDSRGLWRKEGLPRSITLRLLTYHAAGFRPMRLLTNVLDEKDVPYEEFWGLGVSEEGEVLFKGVYNHRWEIETTYLEVKVQQQLEGSLRSRTPEGIRYEVAGQMLYYLLVRWLMVEAAVAAKVSPLRLSFTAALREINEQWQSAVVASESWLNQTLRPRLLQRLASHVSAERPGRTAPRGKKERRAAKRANDAKRAKAAKSRRKKKKDKPLRWFGQGWTLAGRQDTPGKPHQG